MDWDKVINNLRGQTTYYTKQANEVSALSGQYDRVKELRLCADFASILLSALYAGKEHSPE